MTILNSKRRPEIVTELPEGRSIIAQCMKSHAILIRTKDADRAKWVQYKKS